MVSLNKFRNVIKRFKKDEDGQMALMMSVSAVAVISAAGAAMDYTTLSNADSKAQSIADSVALNAAIYVKNHDAPPTSKEQGPYGSYTASELGYDVSGWVKNGASGVSVNVVYDDTKKEARVTVEGKTLPTFAQVMGHDELDFKATSTVKYYDIELKDPASIVLVLDNSGSMAWDDKPIEWNSNGTYYTPSDAIPRIDALEDSVIDFMTDLNNLVGDQTTVAQGERVLRTGMLAYNSDTISARTVSMKWGTLSNSNITSMSADGGTNSAPPMDTARQWMALEDTVHQAEHGKSPLKFAIFMTDGVNTAGDTEWRADDTTGYWRKWLCGRRGCKYYHYSEQYNPNYNFAANGYEEGEYKLLSNEQTLADCEALQDNGVKVYTIGFALEEGWYEANYTNWWGDMQYEYISSDTSQQAYAFLQGCASSAQEFIAAENAGSLTAAFQTIGNDIVNEIIRISG